MTAIPLTVLPTSGFPSTVKPTTASIKIDWWMFVSFGTSFFGYYCSGFSRCGFATHGFPMCGPSICDSFRSDTTKKQAHMRIAVVPAIHIWALIVDFWLHPHRCFSCHSLCKVVLTKDLPLLHGSATTEGGLFACKNALRFSAGRFETSLPIVRWPRWPDGRWTGPQPPT